MAMASPAGKSSAYVPRLPPPPPYPPGAPQKTTYNETTRYGPAAEDGGNNKALHQGVVLVLRAGAATAAFVAVALVASCRHGDWMEFGRYREYWYLLGASAVACVYSAAQALRNFRRMRRGYSSPSFIDFAGDQVVAYLLMTASSAALPITIRMRSAVINIFTDAITAAICLGFLAFAALALSAVISGFRIAAATAQPPYYYH